MEYKILKIKNNALFNNKKEYDLSQFGNILDKRYEKVLKNLLQIKSRGESSIFTPVNKSNIDLFSILKLRDINDIYSKYSFKIKIPRTTMSEIEEIIKTINTKKELMDQKEKLNLSQNFINLFEFNNKDDLQDQKQWKRFKKEVLEKSKENIASFNSRWTRFVKNVNDIYDQTNIWPLYIGTYFIKGNFNGKSIYAPLIYKEVEIKEEENEMYIHSRSESIIINEKLMFFLEEYKNINIPEISKDVEKISFFDCTSELNHFFRELIQFDDFHVLGKFEKLKATDVVDPEITREKGIILSICNPVGSSLRKSVLELIKERKLDNNLIKSKNEFFGFDDGDFVEKIIDKQEAIPRICRTDLSQEKAIMSALNDSTIIIGPPGTGKSQTIANIIANILYENKTALFISQKKVALQVVLERLKLLRFFTLQLVENNGKIKNDEKEDFYRNLNKYLEIISKAGYSSNNTYNNEFTPIISKEQIEYWKSKEFNISDEDIKLFCRLKASIKKMDKKLIESFSTKRKDYESLTEDSINIFNYLKEILNKSFNMKFLESVLNNLEGLNNLKQEEISKFIQFINIYNQDSIRLIDKNKLAIFLRDREKISSISWDEIRVFKKIFILNSSTENNIKQMLIEVNNIFNELKSINKLKYVDKMYVLSYTEDKNIFAKEFEINKKQKYMFKYWDKDFKKWWSINQKFKNVITKYSISRNLIEFLYENNNDINKYIEDTEFFIFMMKEKINFDAYEELKKNLTILHSWLKYYDFLNVVNFYSLNESAIYILKGNQKLLKSFADQFDFYSMINEYKIKYYDIELIRQVRNLDKLIELYDVYENHHSDFLPTTNEFKEDIKKITKKVIDDSFKVLNSFTAEEKEKFRKLKGRIERAFTKPYILISLFKDIFKKMFNVVVSTPESLATYIDFINEKYDYVIFDEASQMFLEKAIPFLAIGKKIIIAGDNQQMQPSNWFGLRVDEEEDEQEDENIDSLLDYAVNSGVIKQDLELNYRSDSANLTTFSSKHFYDSKLKCVDNRKKTIPNSIEVFDINGTWKDNTNEEEARMMIKLLKENINRYERIILLTFNANQMELVNYILSEEEKEIYRKIWIDRKVILKNLENIQGDEADLVIISVGYTRDSKLASTYICRPGGRNALNVAITRAKSKMIVLKSIKSNEVTSQNNNVQLFKYWLNFIESTENHQRNYSISSDAISNEILKTESKFEEAILGWLSEQSFRKHVRPVAQYEVGSYRIDIALLDLTTNAFLLGIEVDGFKYHSTARQKYNDEIRQNFIESKGYKIMRIPELLWETNKEKIINEINSYLETFN